jgi:hypothetical protein
MNLQAFIELSNIFIFGQVNILNGNSIISENIFEAARIIRSTFRTDISQREMNQSLSVHQENVNCWAACAG